MVPLWEYRGRDDHMGILAALLDGYREHRALPDLTHLDDFIATRDVGFGLWFVGMAQVHSAFAADLEKVIASVHQRLDRVL